MRPANNRERCKKSILLPSTTISCISFVLVYFFLTGRGQKTETKFPEDILIQPERLTEDRCIPVCESKDCISQAEKLLRNMNTEVNPCENFQTFLCGLYEQTLDRDEYGESGLSRAGLAMYQKMKDIIESIEAPVGSASSKLKIVYESCVNSGSSDLRGINDFQQFLNTIGISNWPYLSENFSFSEGGIAVVLGTLKAHNEARPIVFSLIEDEKNYLNKKHVQVYFDPFLMNQTNTVPRIVAADILKYFDISLDDIELILNDYDNVKNILSNLEIENDIECDEDCTLFIDCLTQEDSAWKYLCKAAKVFVDALHLSDIANSDKISVNLHSIYPTKNLIPTLNSLTARSVANYFALDMFWRHLDEINFFFRWKKSKNFQHFQTQEKQVMMITDRWAYCLEWIGTYMKIPLENEYIQRYFTSSLMNEVLNLHQNYTTEVGDMIQQQEWISEPMKTIMSNWIKRMQSNFSILKMLFPDDILANEHLKMFNPTPDSFFLNVLDLFKNIMNNGMRDINMGFGRNETKFQVNAAFYDERTIGYHYGIFFPPFFYPNYNREINRILFAPAAVHEIGHSVLTLLNQMSELPGTIKIFLKKKKHCIRKQFSKFKFRYLGENLKGKKYVDENLSDNLAQTLIDKMIRKITSSAESFSLPGLSYTPAQQFYMSTKGEFCSKSSLLSEKLNKEVDPHAPLEFRIIGTLQNSRRFSKAFGCPKRSYMNPRGKCSLLD